jgi:hypothetical protein
MEDIERPSFENFLSKPGTLTDHLAFGNWVRPEPAARGARGRRADHWQPQRRRLPHRQRRRNAGRRPACNTRSRCRGRQKYSHRGCRPSACSSEPTPAELSEHPLRQNMMDVALASGRIWWIEPVFSDSSPADLLTSQMRFLAIRTLPQPWTICPPLRHSAGQVRSASWDWKRSTVAAC